MGAKRLLALLCLAISPTALLGGWLEARADDRLITPDAMGPVRLGMTLAQARAAVPSARFERASDGDGAALVSVDFGDAELSLWAREDDPDRPIDWSRPIVTITTFSKAFHTERGIHPGMLVTELIAMLGPVQEIVVSEIESRQFVTFERQPPWLTFRLDYKGRFSEGARRTREYEPGARILGITITSQFRDDAPWRVVAWRPTGPPLRIVSTSTARQPAAPALGPAWATLLGEWKGEGGGSPGAGVGGESFTYDLDKHVILRRGTSDYPAAGAPVAARMLWQP